MRGPSRARHPPDRLRLLLLLIIGITGGAFVGRLATHEIGGLGVYNLDPSLWRVISPGLSEGMGSAGAGRITHVSAGALTITEHVFFRPDTVVPQINGRAHTIEVDLARDSATLRIRIGALPGVDVHLTPTHFMVPLKPDSWAQNQSDGAYRFTTVGDRLMLDAGGDPVDVGAVQPGGVELHTEGGQARVRRIRIEDAAGSVLLDEDFGSWPTPAWALTTGTIFGGFAGCLAALLTMGAGPAAWFGLVVLLSLPIGVLMLDPGVWLIGVERLYLKHMSPSDLVQAVVALSTLPLFAAVVVRCVRLGWFRAFNRTVPSARLLWWAATIGAIAMGLRSSLEGGWATGLLGGGYLLIWGLRSGRNTPNTWWLFDLPAVASVAFFGLGEGLLIAVCWRLIVGVATAGWWLERGPRLAVDLLLLSGLFALPSLEIFVQQTALDDAWDPARLRLERPNEKGWRDPVPGWMDRCGSSDSAQTWAVAVAGGSSTGGAYQFSGDPKAFFPYHAFDALCDRLPADTALVMESFGWGDRNSFTIARTIDKILEGGELEGEVYPRPDVLILYVGVNDLLTQHNTLTRKQREEKMAARGPTASGVAAIGRRSRLVTAVSLLFRVIPDPRGAMMPDVPLADAEENHEIIARAVEARGGRLLLITEHIQSDLSYALAPYQTMQARIASAHEGVSTFELDHVFDGLTADEVLLDSNHLTRAGSRVLGHALADRVGAELGLISDPG